MYGRVSRSSMRDPPEKANMTQQGKVTIKKLPTGVPGLNEILGGGLPEFSFNIIAGAPGCGKTTLAHQFVFANATPERPALYFTVLGEPAMKMLRYQQQYTFFDPAKLNKAIRFVNLNDAMLGEDFSGVLDPFRSMARGAPGGDAGFGIQLFVQRLAVLLSSAEATTFLIGEYSEQEM